MLKVLKNFTAQELKTAHEMSEYEDKWIAVAKKGNKETVVASGARITDVKAAADEKGVKNPTYRKIPSARKILIARLATFSL